METKYTKADVCKALYRIYEFSGEPQSIFGIKCFEFFKDDPFISYIICAIVLNYIQKERNHDGLIQFVDDMRSIFYSHKQTFDVVVKITWQKRRMLKMIWISILNNFYEKRMLWIGWIFLCDFFHYVFQNEKDKANYRFTLCEAIYYVIMNLMRKQHDIDLYLASIANDIFKKRKWGLRFAETYRFDGDNDPDLKEYFRKARNDELKNVEFMASLIFFAFFSDNGFDFFKTDILSDLDIKTKRVITCAIKEIFKIERPFLMTCKTIQNPKVLQRIAFFVFGAASTEAIHLTDNFEIFEKLHLADHSLHAIEFYIENTDKKLTLTYCRNFILNLPFPDNERFLNIFESLNIPDGYYGDIHRKILNEVKKTVERKNQKFVEIFETTIN